MTVIQARQLTTFQVAPDGRSVALNVTDEHAEPATLVFPSECLNELLMTLPDIVHRALRLRFRDESMRVVYPVGTWDVERGQTAGQLIVTLRTPDGFAVSFSLPALELVRMASRATGGDAPDGVVSN